MGSQKLTLNATNSFAIINITQVINNTNPKGGQDFSGYKVKLTDGKKSCLPLKIRSIFYKLALGKSFWIVILKTPARKGLQGPWVAGGSLCFATQTTWLPYLHPMSGLKYKRSGFVSRCHKAQFGYLCVTRSCTGGGVDTQQFKSTGGQAMGIT